MVKKAVRTFTTDKCKVKIFSFEGKTSETTSTWCWPSNSELILCRINVCFCWQLFESLPQGTAALNKDNKMLGTMGKNRKKQTEGTALLLHKISVFPHLKYHMQVWPSWRKKKKCSGGKQSTEKSNWNHHRDETAALQ